MDHPRERASQVGRRDFLMGLAACLPVSAALLAACDRDPKATPAGSPMPLARANNPVTRPLFDSNPAIPDGLSPEKNASLRIYGWNPPSSYMSPRLVSEFEERYGCSVRFVEPFTSMDQAVARLRTGNLEADVFQGTTLKVLGSLVDARMIQPLNLAYLPNLNDHAWPQMINPFYDVGSRYTVPYFVWTTGIAWRNDLVETDIPSLADPYGVFWDPANRGHVHMLDSVQDVIGMALLRRGVTDVNTENPLLIERAKDDLLDMVEAVLPKFDITDYRDLLSGAAHVHLSWSGDMTYARHYASKPSDILKLSYWWPKEGLIGSDTMTVLKGAENPVLAHAFLDFLLDGEKAFANSVYTGYQAPVSSVTPDSLVDDGAVPPNLRNIIVTPEDFVTGREELELSPAGDALWHAAYSEVLKAAESVA
jgi:spermidine/putrescine transport system substrate-binding protein